MERYGRRQLLARGAGLVAGGTVVGALDPAAAGAAITPSALKELRMALGAGALLRPGDGGYGVARLPWNIRYDDVRPAAVALPRNAAEVKACVKWAVKHDARLAIRSGGHSTAGQSSTPGLLVDLRRLDGMTLVGERARVGAGARLGTVYARLWASGERAIPAGTAPTVGLAGLTLGGGHGFLARRFGLACDIVRAVEVVTADGKLRRCTSAQEQDLFWALRGGGQGSFGVVTALELRTRRPGPVTTVALRWPWARAREIVEAWTTFIATAPAALSCVLSLRVPPTTGGEPILALNGLVVGTKAAADAIVAPLVTTTSPAQTVTVQRTWAAAVTYFAGAQSDVRHGIAVASGYATQPLDAAGRGALVDAVEARHANPALRRGGAVLFALGGAVNAVAPAATAFVHRRALFSVELLALWETSAQQASNLAWVGAARASVRPHLSAEAAQNYADPGLASPRRAYHGANLERLVSVKQAVDPGNLFRHSQSIPVRL